MMSDTPVCNPRRSRNRRVIVAAGKCLLLRVCLAQLAQTEPVVTPAGRAKCAERAAGKAAAAVRMGNGYAPTATQ